LLSDTPVSAIAINSQGHLFAGTGDRNTQTGGEGIFRSTDNGENWVKLNTELINADIWDLAINSNDDIFAGTNDGLFRSTDNGETWAELNTGFPGIEVWSIAINNSNGHIFAGIFDRVGPGGVIRSIDNGESWTWVGEDLQDCCIRSVAVNSHGDVFAGYGKGVFYSTNEGESWTEINTGLNGRSLSSAARNQF
jgi:photosystem II stability/assembly factor-like uncharacterized protein